MVSANTTYQKQMKFRTCPVFIYDDEASPSVSLSLGVNQKGAAVCVVISGPLFQQGCVWELLVLQNSCSVRVMCWNHLHPLRQLQHLLAHRSQSKERTQCRDESACSVIFFRGSWCRVWTKANPTTPIPPAALTYSILPKTFRLWYVRPLHGRIDSPAHTNKHPTAIQIIPWIMTEKWWGG